MNVRRWLDIAAMLLEQGDADSATLARVHRAGELRAIYVPDATDEALRDLVWTREDAPSRP